ncbi:MAG: PEP-CTERM sorting domain-containing protein [Chthoniobacterales bacterium]
MKNPHSSNVRRCFAAFTGLLVCLAVLAPAPAAAQLIMWFTNTSSYSNNNVWITLQRGFSPHSDVNATNGSGQFTNIPNVTYGTNSSAFSWSMYTNSATNPWQPSGIGNLFAAPVLLSDIVTAGGFLTWNGNAASTAIYISYGTEFAVNQYTLSGVSPNNPQDPNYYVKYQPFELTYGSGPGGLPVNGDQGDLTAINYFGASLQIKSYASTNATGAPLQQSGFYDANIGADLVALTASNTAPDLPGTPGGPAIITNTNTGDLIRVLGPSQFGASGETNGSGLGNYPTFDAYFAGAGFSNAIFSNISAYNTVPIPTTNAPYTNKTVSFSFGNSVTNTAGGYALTPTGTITVVTTAYGFVTNTNTQTPTTNFTALSTNTSTYTDISFNVSPLGSNAGAPVVSNIASQFVYLGSYSALIFGTNVYSWFGGSNLTTLSNDLVGFVDGGGSNAMVDITAQIAGEIATGFAAGFVGSPTYGNLPSDQWWALNPTNAFGSATTNPFDYNQYAAVIAEASSNTVYGMVYSDRFTNSEFSPLIDSVSHKGTNVGSWLIVIGEPINVIPEPSTYALLAMAGAGLAGYTLRRKPR